MDMGFEGFAFVYPHEELNGYKEAFNEGGVQECRKFLERKRDEWMSIPLDVAVIGNSGVGKSSFINAIRRLNADDEGAAAVDVKETTVDIRSYEHPCNPLLKFWDLPGVGTDRFPRETYLTDIEVDRYDFFLLITSTRFTENDTWLGKEIHKRGKKYFFVRTKIGADIFNTKQQRKKKLKELAGEKERAAYKKEISEGVVKVIRESTLQHLRDNGHEDIPVFLIDSYKPKKFDFEQLEHQLVEDFPKLKKTALILSLQATSEEMIRLKVGELRSRIWKVAALSGAVAAIPVPGVSMAFDLAAVVEEADFYYAQLGLDEMSLKRYAKLTSCDYEQLQSVVQSRLGCRIIGVGGIKKLVEELAKRAPLLASTALEETSRFIPLIGSFVAASLSFGGTYYALKLILDKMESVAVEVIKYAADSAAGAELSDDE